jgi:hypothetical protein
MSEPFYVVEAGVRKVDGVHRRATLPTGHRAELGVHGAVKELYDLDAEDLPLPVDYMVAATGG